LCNSHEINAHNGSVVGLSTDLYNQIVVSAGYDGFLHVWDFQSYFLKFKTNIRNSITALEHSKYTSLIAVSTDDFIIRLHIAPTLSLVQQLQGHTNRITKLQICVNSNLLLSSSIDTSIRFWELPSGKCFQVLRFSSPITTISFIEPDNTIATCHTDLLGIQIWTKKILDVEPKEIELEISQWIEDDFFPKKNEMIESITQTQEINQFNESKSLVTETHLPFINDKNDVNRMPEPISPGIVTLTRPNRSNEYKTSIYINSRFKILALKTFQITYTFTESKIQMDTKSKLRLESSLYRKNTLILFGEKKTKKWNGSLLLPTNLNSMLDLTNLISLMQKIPPNYIDTQLKSLNIFSYNRSIKKKILKTFMDFLEVEFVTGRNFEFLNFISKVFLDNYGIYLTLKRNLKVRAGKLKWIIRNYVSEIDSLLTCMI